MQKHFAVVTGVIMLLAAGMVTFQRLETVKIKGDLIPGPGSTGSCADIDLTNASACCSASLALTNPACCTFMPDLCLPPTELTPLPATTTDPLPPTTPTPPTPTTNVPPPPTAGTPNSGECNNQKKGPYHVKGSGWGKSKTIAIQFAQNEAFKKCNTANHDLSCGKTNELCIDTPNTLRASFVPDIVQISNSDCDPKNPDGTFTCRAKGKCTVTLDCFLLPTTSTSEGTSTTGV